MALSKKEQDSIIVNKAMKAASKRRTATKVIIIVLLVALFLSGGAWGVMTFVEANSMKISIDNVKEGLSLSSNVSFEDPTTSINMKGPTALEAYTYSWFNIKDEILSKDGQHNGSGYICYSYYLKNVSETSACLYTMSIKITKNTKNLASAMRIMVIESDEGCLNEANSVKVYAERKVDGTAENIAYDFCEDTQIGLTLEDLNSNYNILDTNMTYPYLGEVFSDETEESLGYYVMQENGKKLSHNAFIKYTIVVWFEGTDMQCVNDVLGGKCTFEVEYSIEEYLSPEYYGN